jgi:hypothetical protein
MSKPKLDPVKFNELMAIVTYGHESASYLSELAHMAVGWRVTKMKEVIPYNTIFLGRGGVTEGDIRRGEELASATCGLP